MNHSVMTCSVIGSNISNDTAGINSLHIHVVGQYFLVVLGFFSFFSILLKVKMYSEAAGVPGFTINCWLDCAPVKIRQTISFFVSFFDY